MSMSADEPGSGPRIFRLDDSRLGTPDAAPIDERPVASSAEAGGVPSANGTARLMRFRRIGWGSIFIGAVSGLVSIGLSIWVTNFVIGLFSQGGWLGYLALVLALIAAFAALMVIIHEVAGFFRLGRIASIRLEAENAIVDGNERRAKDASRRIETLYSAREEMQWSVRRLAEHRRDVLSARELLILTEREMLTPLDRQARLLVSASSRRVALITAVSPSAIIDVGMVVVENLAMIRRLATLYGGRPGFLASLRLARLVLGHLALTGGVALGDDLIQQLLGHGLTARLSAKLGEGLINGAFTGRIGIAAIDLCRPLPFIEAERPRLRDFVAELRKARADAAGGPAPTDK
jgi:putative membrane protein